MWFIRKILISKERRKKTVAANKCDARLMRGKKKERKTLRTLAPVSLVSMWFHDVVHAADPEHSGLSRGLVWSTNTRLDTHTFKQLLPELMRCTWRCLIILLFLLRFMLFFNFRQTSQTDGWNFGNLAFLGEVVGVSKQRFLWCTTDLFCLG